MPPALGLVLGIEAEVEQGVLMRSGYQIDIAAAAAIAAAGAAMRDIFLPPKGQAAITAIPCFYVDFDFVDEHPALRRFFAADELAHAAAVAELDDAGNLGEQRVVLAPTYVLPRLQARAPLPNDDRPSGHHLPAEDLN